MNYPVHMASEKLIPNIGHCIIIEFFTEKPLRLNKDLLHLTYRCREFEFEIAEVNFTHFQRNDQFSKTKGFHVVGYYSKNKYGPDLYDREVLNNISKLIGCRVETVTG